MNIPDDDIRIERTKGTGKGGQRKNKVETAVRLTHIPTGITAYADTRSQATSLKKAKKELVRRIKAADDARVAAAKKADRDRKVASSTRVRTYDQSANRVTDHRTGIKRTFDDVVKGGNIQDFLDGFLADL